MYLAACFRNPIIHRDDEPRNFYREIIEAQIQDEWTGLAQRALDVSFPELVRAYADPNEKAGWFAAAAQQSTNPNAAEFYLKEAKAAETEATLKRSESPEAEMLA